jgi:hypothetical protein
VNAATDPEWLSLARYIIRQSDCYPVSWRYHAKEDTEMGDAVRAAVTWEREAHRLEAENALLRKRRLAQPAMKLSRQVSWLRRENQRLEQTLDTRLSSAVASAANEWYPPPCVYALLLEGQIVYVGESVNFPGRIGAHRADGKIFDSFKILESDERLSDTDVRRKREDLYIHALHPPLNRKCGTCNYYRQMIREAA